MSHIYSGILTEPVKELGSPWEPCPIAAVALVPAHGKTPFTC